MKKRVELGNGLRVKLAARDKVPPLRGSQHGKAQ